MNELIEEIEEIEKMLQTIQGRLLKLRRLVVGESGGGNIRQEIEKKRQEILKQVEEAKQQFSIGKVQMPPMAGKGPPPFLGKPPFNIFGNKPEKVQETETVKEPSSGKENTK